MSLQFGTKEIAFCARGRSQTVETFSDSHRGHEHLSGSDTVRIVNVKTALKLVSQSLSRVISGISMFIPDADETYDFCLLAH